MSHREYIVNGNEKLDTMTGESLFSHGASGNGPAGPAGNPGAAGKSILSGSGAPPSNLGSVGDLYIDTDTGDLWLLN